MERTNIYIDRQAIKMGVLMELKDVHAIFYITHVENLSSIMKSGILCHHKAEAVGHVSIASEEVLSSREGKTIPNGKPLFHYVNLYFNPRNPMMYKVTDAGRKFDDICVLEVEPRVMSLKGVIITDSNAASPYVRFYSYPQGVQTLNKDEIFAEKWTHDNPWDTARHRVRMCAEILVPEVVPTEYMMRVLVPNADVRHHVEGLVTTMPINIMQNIFFR